MPSSVKVSSTLFAAYSMKNNCTYFQRNWGNTVKSGDFLWKQAALNIGPDNVKEAFEGNLIKKVGMLRVKRFNRTESKQMNDVLRMIFNRQEDSVLHTLEVDTFANLESGALTPLFSALTEIAVRNSAVND